MAERPYPSFLIYIDSDKQFCWRLQASVHETIADSGEGYQTYGECRSAIASIRSPHPVWQSSEVTKRTA